jgi:hypothetical protein
VANGGGTVVEVEDATNGLCLATASNGKAELGACHQRRAHLSERNGKYVKRKRLRWVE